MKKFIAMLLALVMALSLAACGAKEETPETPEEEVKDYSTMTIDELKAELTTVSDGKLTVATSPDFAPYEFYSIDANGDYYLAGFDMALAQYIADYLGLELEVIPMDFDGTLTELASKSVDLSLAGYSPDPDRMDKMDFSDIYYEGGQSFVTVKDKADLFKTLADTNKAEYTISAQNASIQMNLAQENSPEADIIAATKVTDIIADLIAGKVDGAYIETAVAECYAINYPELAIVLDVPYDVSGSSVGVSKDNAPLLAAVNLAIAACKADGTFDSYVAAANELAAGEVYEGLLDDTVTPTNG